MSNSSLKKPPLEDETPMMQQYQSIKRDHPDSILFFRMGDFYEMFNEDAKIASRVLEISLTSRNKNKSNPIPMCGIPHHSANLYISKLIKSGRKIAICEQVEDPRQAKGLVKREVVRVISPGTVLDDNLLDPKNNHFIVSLYLGNEICGLAALDLTTGLFKVTELSSKNGHQLLLDELTKLEPKEVLIQESILNGNGNTPEWLNEGTFFLLSCEDWTYAHSQSHRLLLEHFKTQSLAGFGCEEMKAAVCAAGALIQYLRDTQKGSLQHINTLSTFNLNQFMMIDQATVNSLELVRSSDGQRKYSLLDLLDESCTPLGARRVREWILKPLADLDSVQKRLNRVETFKTQLLLRNDLREQLKNIHDIERLLGRIALSACSPRDMTTLKSSLAVLPSLHQLLQSSSAPSLNFFLEKWDNLEQIHDRIDQTMVDDPPFNTRDGHLIRSGCHPELDRLKTIARDGNQSIAELEARERERTGIPQLKVGYNKIYGYYIEITKKNLDRVPDDYIRKQSLVNSERYISPELKQHETEITGAEDKIIALEQELFQKLREDVAAEGTRIQEMAHILGDLDGLLSFAEVAHQYNYCRPSLNDGDNLRIVNGRHPLVEQIDPSHPFLSNDTNLDCTDNQIMIITGPNMAGKSTYLRQVALITLMAQIGSFVPADEALIGQVDRIFSRVGAQDHLHKGLSTFMVEMNETANILNNATKKSLIILDEIGRGTSTFDGISLAWSIVEYLHASENQGAKTLFATHYHELTDLERMLPGVKNYNVQVKEWNDEIIFLRKILPGGADKSYGIQVARLAGLPTPVLERAREVLSNLENSEYDTMGTPKIGFSQEDPPSTDNLQLNLFQEPLPPIIQKLREIEPDSLSPREALDLIYNLVQLLPPKSD